MEDLGSSNVENVDVCVGEDPKPPPGNKIQKLLSTLIFHDKAVRNIKKRGERRRRSVFHANGVVVVL